MELEKLNIYKISMDLGEEIYSIVDEWDYFAKRTIGVQIVSSADSIAVNISEGFGRFHYKDVNNFNFYARGSLYETKTWIKKSKNRGLLSDEKFQELEKTIKDLSVKLNNYINAIKNKSQNNV